MDALRDALAGGDRVVATGVILLELLRGFVPERAQQTIREDFASLDVVEPRWSDYEDAAELSNTCRRGGVQLGSIGALIAELAIAHDLALLTTRSGLRPRRPPHPVAGLGGVDEGYSAIDSPRRSARGLFTHMWSRSRQKSRTARRITDGFAPVGEPAVRG